MFIQSVQKKTRNKQTKARANDNEPQLIMVKHSERQRWEEQKRPSIRFICLPAKAPPSIHHGRCEANVKISTNDFPFQSAS